jgi:hypothetical protein
MKKEQIEYVLDALGYVVDEWITLEDVPLVTMSMLTNIYTDKNTIRFRFNMDTENLEIVYGNTVDNLFTSLDGDTADYTPQSFVRFEIIMGFHRSVTSNNLYSIYNKRGFGGPVDYKIN